MGKRFLNDPRLEALNVGDVKLEHDFTNACQVVANNLVQSGGLAIPA